MTAQEIRLEVVSARQRRGSGPGALTGEGETQLEIERRIIHNKEAKIKREILAENSQRLVRREKKMAIINPVPNIAPIGYTNSGKSAIMNRLTKANVISDDKLFQTLHTTAKKMKLKSGQLGVLLDTIGFITHLPHELVESFKTTLEEVKDADLVLHVRDISHPNTEDQKQTVMDVLKEIGFDEAFYTKRMIEVWNKIDLMTKPLNTSEIKNSPIPIIPISALYGTNVEKLIDTVTEKANVIMGKRTYTITNSLDQHSERLNWLIKNGNIPVIEDYDFDYTVSKEYPFGSVSFAVALDDVTYRRFKATFDKIEKDRASVDLPTDWLKDSKSYFEKRAEQKQQSREQETQKQEQEEQALKKEKDSTKKSDNTL